MQGLQKGRSQGTAAQEPIDLQQKKNARHRDNNKEDWNMRACVCLATRIKWEICIRGAEMRKTALIKSKGNQDNMPLRWSNHKSGTNHTSTNLMVNGIKGKCNISYLALSFYIFSWKNSKDSRGKAGKLKFAFTS